MCRVFSTTGGRSRWGGAFSRFHFRASIPAGCGFPLVCLVAWLLGSGCTAIAQQAATQPARERERGLGNRLAATPNDVHRLILDDPVSFAESTPTVRTSRVIETEFPFNDLIPSWNVDLSPDSGFSAEIRLGRREDGFWTPYYYLGSWGEAPRIDRKHLRDEHGFINIDYFQSRNRFDRIQYRLLLKPGDDGALPVPRRFGMAYSNTLDDAALARRFRAPIDPGPREKWARRLPVPYRSQRWEDERIRGSICSPTSVSMVLEYRGVKHPTAAVCATIFDPEYRLYGNWWRAVQGAYSYGVSGYLERFGDWNAVKRHIAAGQPVIASIRVRRGEMTTAPYRQTDGHLIVITGFDEHGDVCVNDPAADSAKDGQTTYKREDMDKVWLARGGVGYILLPRTP